MPPPRKWGVLGDARTRPGDPLGGPLDSFELLEFDGGASAFEGRLGLLSVSLGDLLEDGLGSCVNQVLGFLQAEVGEGANFLNYLDLLVTSVGDYDVEVALLVSTTSSVTAISTCHIIVDARFMPRRP